MLAILGFFPFHTATIPFHEASEKHAYKHPVASVVNSMAPPSQFVGKEAVEYTLVAELRPEVSGGDWALRALQAMADTGNVYPLIWGTGIYQGVFKIKDIDINRHTFMSDGKAQAISVTITLLRQDGSLVELGKKGYEMAKEFIKTGQTWISF